MDTLLLANRIVEMAMEPDVTEDNLIAACAHVISEYGMYKALQQHVNPEEAALVVDVYLHRFGYSKLYITYHEHPRELH